MLKRSKNSPTPNYDKTAEQQVLMALECLDYAEGSGVFAECRETDGSIDLGGEKLGDILNAERGFAADIVRANYTAMIRASGGWIPDSLNKHLGILVGTPEICAEASR